MSRATSVPRPARLLPIIALAGVVSHVFGRATMPILLPAIDDELLDSTTVAGSLGTVNFGGYLLGVVVVTALAGRVEPVQLVRGGAAVVAGGLTLLAMADSVGTLVAGNALMGVGGAGIWIVAPALATIDVPEHRRARVMAWLTVTMGIGFVLVPQVVRLVRATADDPTAWRPVWGIEAAVAAVLVVVLVLFVRVPPTPPETAGIRLAPLRAMPSWVPVTVAYVAFAFVGSTFSQFLGLALRDDHGLSDGTAAVVFSLFGMSSAIGPLAYGWLSDRFGRTPVMAWSFASMAMGALLLPVGATAVIVVAVILFGTASFSYPILNAAWVRDHAEARGFGAALGVMTIFYGPGAMAGPQLGGVVADITESFTATYLMVAAVAAIGGAAAWWARHRSETRLT